MIKISKFLTLQQIRLFFFHGLTVVYSHQKSGINYFFTKTFYLLKSFFYGTNHFYYAHPQPLSKRAKKIFLSNYSEGPGPFWAKEWLRP